MQHVFSEQLCGRSCNWGGAIPSSWPTFFCRKNLRQLITDRKPVESTAGGEIVLPKPGSHKRLILLWRCELLQTCNKFLVLARLWDHIWGWEPFTRNTNTWKKTDENEIWNLMSGNTRASNITLLVKNCGAHTCSSIKGMELYWRKLLSFLTCDSKIMKFCAHRDHIGQRSSVRGLEVCVAHLTNSRLPTLPWEKFTFFSTLQFAGPLLSNISSDFIADLGLFA